MEAQQRIGGRHRLELVRRRDERQAAIRCNVGGDARAEFGMRVQARADRGPALRQLENVRQRRLDVCCRVPELRGVAGELLAERERCGVLQMCTADLDDVGEGSRFRRQRGLQRLQRRQQIARHRLRRSDIHRGRKNIVRRLAAIDVVIGVDEAPLAARSTQDLGSAVGQHFVDVHVGLRARSRLPDRSGRMQRGVVRRAFQQPCCRAVP